MNEKAFEKWFESKTADGKFDWIVPLMKTAYEAGYEQGQKDLREQEIEDRDFHTVLKEATEKYQLGEYRSLSYQKFIVNMHNKGYELQHYNGRNIYEGPAVVVPKIKKDLAEKHSQVVCQWDQMGKSSVVVYPSSLK